MSLKNTTQTVLSQQSKCKRLSIKKTPKNKSKPISSNIKKAKDDCSQEKQKGSEMQDKDVQQQKLKYCTSDLIQQEQKLKESSVFLKKLLEALLITENNFDEPEDLGEIERLVAAPHERQNRLKTCTYLYLNGLIKAMDINKLNTENLDIHLFYKSIPDVAKSTVNLQQMMLPDIKKESMLTLFIAIAVARHFKANKDRSFDVFGKINMVLLVEEDYINRYLKLMKISLDKNSMEIIKDCCSLDNIAIHKNILMRCIIDYKVITNYQTGMSMRNAFICERKKQLQNADHQCDIHVETSAMMKIKECPYTKVSCLLSSKRHTDFKEIKENGIVHNCQSNVGNIVVNEDSNIMKGKIEGDTHNQVIESLAENKDNKNDERIKKVIESLAENKDNKNDERSKKNSNDVHGVRREKLPTTSKMHLIQPYRILYDADALDQILIESEKDCPYILYPAAHPLLLEKIRRIAPSSEMNPFTQRIHSFVLGDNPMHVSWPDSAIVRPLQLACAGFSYEGYGQEIICNFCGFRTNTDCWLEIDENYAMSVHRNAGTTCPFMNTFINSETVITDNIEENVIEESEVYSFYYLVCQFDSFYTDIKILNMLFNRKGIIIVELFERQSWNELIVKQRQIYYNLVSTLKKQYRKNM